MGSFGNAVTRPNEPPMPEPLAFFITWTTYGTWLPGDERGWVLKGKGFQLPQLITEKLAADRTTEPACTLDDAQREVVEKTIDEHCRIRNWHLHAVSCRSNHVHVVVTADLDPKKVRDQLKAWCTRRLKEHCGHRAARVRQKWWTAGGSRRFIGDQQSLEAVICYVLRPIAMRDAGESRGRE